MTRKTCFCHLMSKQTTPKDMQYNVMPDQKSRLNCANCSHLTMVETTMKSNTVFLSSKSKSHDKRDQYSCWTRQDVSAIGDGHNLYNKNLPAYL